MKIGILAVQGAFIEHETKLARLGAECIELRQKSDLEKKFEGLVLPGGESTVQGKLLRELNMFQTLKTEIESGMPVLATCAGLIQLAEKLSNDSRVYFGTLPVTVKMRFINGCPSTTALYTATSVSTLSTMHPASAGSILELMERLVTA